jgi:Tetrahydromethanopterin S-methyltransferase, subunit A
VLKAPPHPDYPPEEGRYLRGNDASPVAVAIILNCEADKIPREIVALFRAGIESGAALSGTVQTENIGFEKIICNIVANPTVEFCGYALYDVGAYPEPPLAGRITWRVAQPWAEPPDDKEREAVRKAQELIERLKARNRKDQG